MYADIGYLTVGIGVVDAKKNDALGQLVHIETATGDQTWARVAFPVAGPKHGMYFEVDIEDTVLFVCPTGRGSGGDPGDGAYVIARFYEEAEPQPQTAKDNPSGVELWRSKAGNKLYLETGNGDLVLWARDDGGRGKLRCGSPDASEAAILGNKRVTDEKTMLKLLFTGLNTLAIALKGFAPLAPVAASMDAAAQGVNTFAGQLDGQLSGTVLLDK